MCRNDELSWLFTTRFLFAENSQILLKISGSTESGSKQPTQLIISTHNGHNRGFDHYEKFLKGLKDYIVCAKIFHQSLLILIKLDRKIENSRINNKFTNLDPVVGMLFGLSVGPSVEKLTIHPTMSKHKQPQNLTH